MEIEFIKDKVYYKIFDRTYTASSGKYSKHRSNDAAILAEVQKNIDNIQTEHNANGLVILKQVHGNNVIFADDSHCQSQEEADGSTTTSQNIALGILTADCVPVLLASSDGSVIGAAHCGWKSAKANIITKLHEMMLSEGAKEVKALIGPSIQQKSYEVDNDYYLSFVNEDADSKKFFVKSQNENHYMFDLPAYVKNKLEIENIEVIVDINDDTYELEDQYPSFRRCTHRNEQYNNNILSTIIIR
jgi:YfiH family protein